MTVAIAGGPAAVPNSSWLKFFTIGASVNDRGFVAGVTGSVQYTNRIGGVIVTRMVYDTSGTDEFTFEIDESSGVGFTFTQLIVQSAFGEVTLTRASAVAYAGFPLKGWIWDAADYSPPMWTLANVGTTKYVKVQR